MKLANILVIGALAAALAPTAAQADHCGTPIYLFSRTRVGTNETGATLPSVTSAAVGCTASDEAPELNDPSTHFLIDTDIIYPGANRMSVRLLDNGTDPAAVLSATLKFAGKTYELAMAAGTSTAGAATWLDSQNIEIDPATTIGGGDAVITICMVFDPENCFTRTFRTVA